MSPPRFVFKKAPAKAPKSVDLEALIPAFISATKTPGGITAREFARKHRVEVLDALMVAKACAFGYGVRSKWKARPDGGQESLYCLPTEKERGVPCSASF
jgi:hypothetical protein